MYDHPRVLIFHKSDAYSRERVETALGGIDLSQAQTHLTTQEATPAWARVKLAPIICPGMLILLLGGVGVYRLTRERK